MKKRSWTLSAATICIVSTLMVTGCGGEEKKVTDNSLGSKTGKITITNVSYDPTRELYATYNELFSDYYKSETGTDVEIVQSHGGSGEIGRAHV